MNNYNPKYFVISLIIIICIINSGVELKYVLGEVPLMDIKISLYHTYIIPYYGNWLYFNNMILTSNHYVYLDTVQCV